MWKRFSVWVSVHLALNVPKMQTTKCMSLKLKKNQLKFEKNVCFCQSLSYQKFRVLRTKSVDPNEVAHDE